MSEPARVGEHHAEVVELIPVVRRVVAARVSDPTAVEDLVQETLTRVLPVERRLDATALAPYAIVTARNLVRSHARREERGRRHLHRLADRERPVEPEEVVVEDEEREAMAAALARLPPLERQSLLSHEVEGVDTAALAEEVGGTPGATAARLARARARLRVEYVLALRGVELPTVRCKPVLLALSAGDQRRQRALGAGEHLLACPSCSDLSAPLLARRRVLAGLLPWLGLDRLARAVARRTREQPARTAATTAVAVGVVALTVGLAVSGDEAPAPPPPLFVRGDRPIPLSGARPLAPYAGRQVEARGVEVQAVPANEGFWVGASEAERVWVQLIGEGESPFRVTTRQRVSFVGVLVPNSPAFLEAAGVPVSSGRGQLEQQGHHVEVPVGALRRT